MVLRPHSLKTASPITPMSAHSNATASSDSSAGLSLLIRLRWLALAGQIGLCLFASLVLEMALPWAMLLFCMAITALTNSAASLRCTQAFLTEQKRCGVLLVLDTLTLTAMLYWTGGAHNPFATFYLLHIAIATIILSYRAAWALVFLSGLCYALLFASPYTLESLSTHAFCGSFDFHLQGMLLSMILVGMGIVFFSGQLKITLAKKEAQLQKAQLEAARNERFASLATLAAGVAHELATPLGTIAIASEDLEEQAASGRFSEGCHRDAALIRSEVQRCCEVIEKLREQTHDGVGEPLQPLALSKLPSLLEAHLKPEHWQRLQITALTTTKAVHAPQTALLQSLAVLIKNACQASAVDAPVLLKISEQTEVVHFAIIDSGAGIPAETICRLGEPFFTTKEPGQGMGLGLFLVRMFVERIRGSLSIDSAPGKGTTITLTAPAHESAAD